MTLKTLLVALLAASTATAQGLAHPVGLQPGDEYRVLFVTHSTRDATSSDIQDYDAFVTSDANAVPFLAALNTSWRAVASTAAVAAKDHTDTAGGGGVPIFRPDGRRVAYDYDHFWGAGSSAPLLAAPGVTARGALTSDFVWSGTFADGAASAWPLGGPSTAAAVGAAADTGPSWMHASSAPRTGSHRLYGLSDVLTVPYAEYPRDRKPGDQFRILFVSDAIRDATSASIVDYDAFVAADAQAVPALRSFRTSWRAVASTPTVSADAHTDTAGGGGVPIYRPDGMRVANDYAHLWGAGGGVQLLALPNITASGAVTSASSVWSGTLARGGSSPDPLGGSSGDAIVGKPNGIIYNWIWSARLAQTVQRPLYGISDVITVPEPRHPRDLQPGQRYRVLVVTDASRDATSSNIADYDDFVTADADAVQLMRLLDTGWRAVASTPTVSADAHTDTAGGGGVPIYRPDGMRVANDYAHLWGAGGGVQLLALPNITASGAVTSASSVWSGTLARGGSSPDPLGGSSGDAIVGKPNGIIYNWIWSARLAQTVQRPLYGISDVITVPGPRHPQDLQPGQPYRVLFVTDAARDATSSNIADYDGFVRAEADAVRAMRRLDTDWRALASTPSVSADVHTGTDGGGGVPIYRPDGVRIANDYDHLWSAGSTALLAPPNVTTSGGAPTLDRVWTGTSSNGSTSTEPLGGSSGNADAGRPDATSYSWVRANLLAQTSSRPLYGISEVLYVPFPAEIGTSCGSATLSRDTLPVLGTAFRCTLSGVPQNGIGAVFVDLRLPTAGTPQPTPPFLVGCMSYLSAPVTLGITLQQSQQFAVAIPNDAAYVGLPIAMQGAAIDLSTGEVTTTNAIAARVRD